MIDFEGKKYARVSDILSPLKDFSQIDPDVLDKKIKLGTSVHDAIADDIAGDFPDSDGKGLRILPEL